MSYLEKVFEPNIPDEWRWERIRIYRNDLLRECDVMVIADAPWDKTPWIEYRQKLRDLPDTETDPSKIVFPNKPSV